MLSHAYKILVCHSVGSPVNGKYVAYGLNATDKKFLTMLMITVKLPGTATNDSQMFMHTAISNTYISLSRVFQKHLSEPTCAHGFINSWKYRKRSSKRKFMERDYHIQDNKDVQHKSVKIPCASKQFYAMSFFCLH